nr:3-phosphoshikimate 1-carboxyvinyltransferase [Clostridia bacterium]
MKVVLSPFKADGEISAPPSKSFAHRYIIAAFLAGKKCAIHNVGFSEDVISTVSAVRSLGGIVEKKGDTVIVSGKAPVRQATVDCGESGSTMRFLMPVAAALGIEASFTGRGKLISRPVEDISAAIQGHGATVFGHTVRGKLVCGVYRISGNLSSQFASGLLFALSALSGDSEIIFTGDRVSKGYIDITVSVLREFGVKISETVAGYKIKGGFNPPEKAFVEGDWSGAASPLAIGALCGRVAVKNLKYPSLQPDSAVLDILCRFGAKASAEKDKITVEKGTLCGIDEIYCENFPDIAQVICSVAAFSSGTTRLTGVNRLKIKESDRIAAIINTLKTCGVRAEYDGVSLTVYGGAPKGGDFDGGKDHRTVMSAAVIAAAADGISTITESEYCAKSYPSFFEDIKLLGGKADVGI